MVYSGNKLLNINNDAFLIMLLFCGLIFANNQPYIGAVILLLSLLFTVNEAFYFELTTDEFIVKNYLLPFLNIRYNLNDITGIELASTNYKATADAAVQITRDDKTLMSFRSTCLGLKDWQALVNDLSDRKIPVIVSASRLVNKIGIPEN
jgi:hypothetical protein